MKRILVGIDGSDASLKGARVALEFAKALNARVTLLYVARPVSAPAEAPWIDELNRDQCAHGERVLLEARAALNVPALDVETEVRVGAPGEVLVDVAKSDNFDLVVVGATGKNAFKRMLLGSIADRVMHTSEKPVLVVK